MLHNACCVDEYKHLLSARLVKFRLPKALGCPVLRLAVTATSTECLLCSTNSWVLAPRCPVSKALPWRSLAGVVGLIGHVPLRLWSSNCLPASCCRWTPLYAGVPVALTDEQGTAFGGGWVEPIGQNSTVTKKPEGEAGNVCTKGRRGEGSCRKSECQGECGMDNAVVRGLRKIRGLKDAGSIG